MMPSMAELASWPVEVFCEEAVATARSATSVAVPEGEATVIVTVEGALDVVALETVKEKVNVAGP
jgi:hypothetical protein